MEERPYEDSITVPARWQYIAGLGQGPPEALSQCPVYDPISPRASIHGSMKEG